MPSSLSWLDFSEADLRRARETVQLFSQRESRDELGIGTIRDVFSNLLFPGVAAEEAPTEMVDRTREAWEPEIPPPPVGFPVVDSLDFAMPADEAGWLRERIDPRHHRRLVTALAGTQRGQAASNLWQHRRRIALRGGAESHGDGDGRGRAGS